VFQQQIF